MERCLFCGKNKLRMYRLPDSPSRHIFCDGCGAAGPWGDTAEEARALYEAIRPTKRSCEWLWTPEDSSGFWTAQCKEDWPIQMLHEGAKFCTFCGGDLITK